MEYKFNLIFVKHIAIDEDPKAPSVKSESDVPKKYLTVQSMVEFDTFTATHGPGTYLDGNYFEISIQCLCAKLYLINYRSLQRHNEQT